MEQTFSNIRYAEFARTEQVFETASWKV